MKKIAGLSILSIAAAFSVSSLQARSLSDSEIDIEGCGGKIGSSYFYFVKDAKSPTIVHCDAKVEGPLDCETLAEVIEIHKTDNASDRHGSWTGMTRREVWERFEQARDKYCSGPQASWGFKPSIIG